MWEARAEYADGSKVERYFTDDGRPDAEQQYDIECWLIERDKECTYYTVNWINEEDGKLSLRYIAMEEDE